MCADLIIGVSDMSKWTINDILEDGAWVHFYDKETRGHRYLRKVNETGMYEVWSGGFEIGKLEYRDVDLDEAIRVLFDLPKQLP